MFSLFEPVTLRTGTLKRSQRSAGNVLFAFCTALMRAAWIATLPWLSSLAAIPLGRLGTSMECAKVIAFLASDAASFIVGETVEVNGGHLML